MAEASIEGPPASLRWQYLLWFSIVVGILSAGYAYIGMRLVIPFGLSPGASLAAWCALLSLVVLPLASMFLLRFSEKISHAVSWGAYTALGFLSFLFTALIVRDTLLIAVMGIDAVGSVLGVVQVRILPSSLRHAVTLRTNIGVLILAAGLTSFAVFQARRKPAVIRLTLPFPTLPDAFDGFRIVQISDIHAGLTIGRDWIAAVVRQVQELKPDLIAFTGDIADGSVEHLKLDVAPLANLTAPHGKYFVTGNHEYYSGAESWVEHTLTLGFRVLMNEHEAVRRNGSDIVVAGVTDLSGGQFVPSHRSDPKKSIENVPDGSFKILLAHQPRSYYAAEPLGFHLILHGHTHGGQFFPWNLVAGIGQPFLKGLHRRNGTWVYVSNGTGYWGPPLRLGARSEITEITLRKEPTSL